MRKNGEILNDCRSPLLMELSASTPILTNHLPTRRPCQVSRRELVEWRVPEVNAKTTRMVTREMLDCYRRDIYSRHPVFSMRAVQSLRECIELGGAFDCEATRLSAIHLYFTLEGNPG